MLFFTRVRERAYIIYVCAYARACIRNIQIELFRTLLEAEKYHCWKSVTYKENVIFMQKSCLKIWSVRKKAVPLQPFSRLLQVSRKIERKCWKNVMLKISHLQRKSKEIWKKLLKNLVSPKKSSTFAADFALNEKRAQNHSDLWEIEAIM